MKLVLNSIFILMLNFLVLLLINTLHTRISACRPLRLPFSLYHFLIFLAKTMRPENISSQKNFTIY